MAKHSLTSYIYNSETDAEGHYITRFLPSLSVHTTQCVQVKTNEGLFYEEWSAIDWCYFLILDNILCDIYVF